jgi:NAD-dependent dihydropyrimidine dehydrogenase PreA subunit
MKRTKNISIFTILILFSFLSLFIGCSDTSVKTPGNYVYKADVINCTGCGDCVAPCPETAIEIIEIENDIIAIIDPEKCIGCGECYFYCPKNAIVKVKE